MYDELPEDEIEPIVYVADKEGIRRAVNAMLFHISIKLKKYMADVSLEDVRKHGLLLKIRADKEDFSHRPEDQQNDYEEYPYGVEPGDYYTNSDIMPDSYFYGNKLISFLKRMKLMDYFTSPLLDPMAKKQIQSHLISYTIKIGKEKNSNKTKKEIIDWIQGMKDKDLKAMKDKYLKRSRV